MNGNPSTGAPARDARVDDTGADTARTPDHLVGVIRRLRLPLLVLLIGLPAAAGVFSAGQQSVYRDTAEVLLSYQNFASSLTGAAPSMVDQDPRRVAETQSRLARTPLVAQRALSVAGVRDQSPLAFLDNSSARAEPDADLLVFQADDPDPQRASALATAYARAYTAVSRELATASIERARQGALRRIRALERAGDTRSRLYDSLIANEQQLSAMRALQTSNASLIRPAQDATRVEPRPLRNVVLGFGLALVLGACVIAITLAFDTHVREADDAGRVLRLPLLARIPSPGLWQKSRVPMLTEPNSRRAQPYRMLKTTFEFHAFRAEAQAVMVTSAGRREGKSSTAANLALALARAGRRVVLVDFDLREPALHRYFSHERAPGLSEVLTGRLRLEDALVSIHMPGRARGLHVTNGDRAREGSLEVLFAGRPLHGRGASRTDEFDVAEAAGSGLFDAVLRRLRVTTDVILFDTPPLLRASEALALTRKVDGVLLTVSSDATRRADLHDLCRLLEDAPAARLGFVFIGPGARHDYGDEPLEEPRSWIPARQHSGRA
jgi:polysaccharide biosynthesis transport protein